MKPLVSFSVHHPISILSLTALLALVGILCIFFIPLDFLPLIPERKLIVSARYDGISASDMRPLVTIPLEDALTSLRGLKTISSTTRDGLSVLTLELHWGNSIDLSLVESREIIDIAYETLPNGCEKPVVTKGQNERDTVSLALIPIDGDLRYARHIAQTDIKPRFQRLSGVGAVSLTGGEKEEIHVLAFRDKIEGRALTLQDIADSLSASNFEYPAGTIHEGEKELALKTSGLFSSLEDIENTAISYNNGALLRVTDVAEVIRAPARKESFFLFNGQEAIHLGIKKKNDASPLTVAARVKNEISRLNETYGSLFHIELVEDMSRIMWQNILSLVAAALAGIFVTILTLKFFLKIWKIALLVASVIPLSILASIIALTLLGKTINTLSLSGIALGIGMVVDAAVVVVENIQRKLHSASPHDYSDCIITGTNELLLSNMGSVLTTIIVFIPMFFLGGILGALFSDTAIAVIASIGFSFILSITYIPALCLLLAKDVTHSNTEGHFVIKCRELYINIMEKAFRHPVLSFLPFIVCMLAAVLLFFLIHFSLLPSTSAKQARLTVVFPLSTSLEYMRRAADDITEALKREPYIARVHISGGLESEDYYSLALPDEQNEKLSIVMELTDYEHRVFNRIAGIFTDTPYTTQSQKNNDLLSGLLDMSGDTAILRDESPEALSRSIASFKSIDTTKEITVVPESYLKETVWLPNRLALARYAISAQYAASLLHSALEGTKALPFYENGLEIPIIVKFRSQDLSSLEALENSAVRLENSFIPLRALGSTQEAINEKILFRYNRMDAKNLVGFSGQNELNSNALFNPNLADRRETLKSATLLSVITLVLLYLALGAQFESFLIPLLVFISIPPAFSGALLFTLIANKPLTINSIMALIVLFGISVNNSIILYEACMIKKGINSPTPENIISACAGKFRAILITTITTIIALIPFAVDIHNTNAQSSLSLAVAGGLIFSLPLVLVIFPICFYLTQKGKKHV